TLPRLVGSVEVVAEDTPAGPAVSLMRLADWDLPPGGIALGTTLSLSYTIDLRQQLVAYERTSVFQWTVPFPGAPGSYVAASVETTSPTVRTVASQTVPFAETFGIVLDPIHYDLRQSPTDGATYSWTLGNVSVTAAGRLVGLIRVDHAPPPFFRWPRVSEPVYGLDADGGLIVLQTCSTLTPLALNQGSAQTTSGVLRAELASTLGSFLEFGRGQPALAETRAFGDPGPDQKRLEVSVPATGPVAAWVVLADAVRAR